MLWGMARTVTTYLKDGVEKRFDKLCEQRGKSPYQMLVIAVEEMLEREGLGKPHLKTVAEIVAEKKALEERPRRQRRMAR